MKLKNRGRSIRYQGVVGSAKNSKSKWETKVKRNKIQARGRRGGGIELWESNNQQKDRGIKPSHTYIEEVELVEEVSRVVSL